MDCAMERLPRSDVRVFGGVVVALPFDQIAPLAGDGITIACVENVLDGVLVFSGGIGGLFHER
jgi:hypothetical protein